MDGSSSRSQQQVDTTTTTTCRRGEEPDKKKHSEEFFANRIQELQKEIKEKLPSHLDDLEAMQAFLTTCQSLQLAMAAKEKAQELVQTLQKEHPDDDTGIQKAQDVVDACDATIESINTLVAATGHLALEQVDSSTITTVVVPEATLLECTVLIQATPKGLADFCALDSDPQATNNNGSLVDEFLSNPDWMRQMIQSGGASKGNYGPAIRIHSQLLLQIKDDDDNPTTTGTTPVRHKLALAVALEHATPIAVFKYEDTCTIDPIHRFWHYVHAFENGELDPAFEDFSVWELRFVIDSNGPDEQLQWGRDYLKAYRPDQAFWSDSEQWRYLWSVRTDVGYRQPEHEFQTYAELLSAGGECGPRAFFGRFICKAFGTPTWGVRQPGHAALSRWTKTSGWIMCMGAAFQWSSWEDNRYTGPNSNNQSSTRHGPDLVEETKARSNTCPCEYYRKLSLLECLAESQGETVMEVVDPTKAWRSLSLAQRKIFAAREKKAVVDYVSPVVASGNTGDQPEATEKITLDTATGSIIIPAASFSSPSKPSSTVMVMPSYLGGKQLHLEQDGSVEYVLPSVIPSGTYVLSCRIVNVHRHQVPLLLTVENQDKEDSWVDMYNVEIQYTTGAWNVTTPVQVQLTPGGTLNFERQTPCHGLTIKDFTLEPSTCA